MSSLREQKQLMRRAVRQSRRNMVESVRVSEESETAKVLLQWWCDQGHPQLAGYAAVGSELSLAGFYGHVWAMGHSVALPRVVDADTDHPALVWHRVNQAADLRMGWKQIPEPDPDRCEEMMLMDCRAALVPGVAFDSQGHRLGQGAGFYDRALSGSLMAIGIGLSSQLVAAVPTESHDRAMDGLVIGGVWMKNPPSVKSKT